MQVQLDCLLLLRNDGLIDNTLLERLKTCIIDTHLEGNAPPMVFARPGLLELIRWASLCSSSASESVHYRSHIQKAFVDSILMSADFFFERYQRYLSGVSGEVTLEGKELERMRRKVQPVMRFLVEYSPPVRDPLLALGRARLLLQEEFFHNNKSYESEFKRKHDDLTVDEYMTCSAALLLIALEQTRQPQSLADRSFEMNINNTFSNAPVMQEPFGKYLRLKAQNREQLSSAMTNLKVSSISDFLDLKPMRERPIFCQDERAVIMDLNLFMDSITVGPLFSLLTADRRYNNGVFSRFGEACHRYVHNLVETCDKSLPATHQAKAVVSEARCKRLIPPKEERSLADIAIIGDSDAAIIETKACVFNEKALKSDSAAFWEEIYRLYGVSYENGEEKRKGFVQLADVTKLLAKSEAEPLGDASGIAHVTDIYPVLMLHDELMHQPNLAHLLALDFVRQFEIQDLPTTGAFGFGRYSVHSLILITLNELEDLQARVLQGPINSYLREYSEWSPERGESLTEFFRIKYPNMSWKPTDEQTLRKAAIEELSSVAVRCFGHEGNTVAEEGTD